MASGHEAPRGGVSPSNILQGTAPCSARTAVRRPAPGEPPREAGRAASPLQRGARRGASSPATRGPSPWRRPYSRAAACHGGWPGGCLYPQTVLSALLRTMLPFQGRRSRNTGRGRLPRFAAAALGPAPPSAVGFTSLAFLVAQRVLGLPLRGRASSHTPVLRTYLTARCDVRGLGLSSMTFIMLRYNSTHLFRVFIMKGC